MAWIFHTRKHILNPAVCVTTLWSNLVSSPHSALSARILRCQKKLALQQIFFRFLSYFINRPIVKLVVSQFEVHVNMDNHFGWVKTVAKLCFEPDKSMLETALDLNLIIRVVQVRSIKVFRSWISAKRRRTNFDIAWLGLTVNRTLCITESVVQVQDQTTQAVIRGLESSNQVKPRDELRSVSILTWSFRVKSVENWKF